MTTTPLPPAIEPVAWFEYARKKPTLKRLVFDRTSRSQLRVAGWVSEPLVKESDATQARADLEAENQRLREALHRIDSIAVFLPTFDVLHEGGIEAVTENIVKAISKAVAALEKQP